MRGITPRMILFLAAVFLGLALIAAVFAFGASGPNLIRFGRPAFYVSTILFVLAVLLFAWVSWRQRRRER